LSADLLAFQIKVLGLPAPVTEYEFHPDRKWRADFCWPEQKLIVEYEGGTWMHGRHTRGSGFEKDCDKYNAATVLGYRVLRFTQKHVKSGEAVKVIQGELR